MAFEGLSDKLAAVFKRLKSKGKLSESDVKLAMREVRLALLEADVNYKVVKDFVSKVSERCVGAEVLESLTPAQQVIKIVNEELCGYIQQAARQGKGADDSGQDGTVGDARTGLLNGLDVDTGAARADGRDGQSFRRRLIGEDAPHYGGHLVVREADLGAEAFGLHRQIHQTHGGAGGDPLGHQLHAAGLERTAGDQVPYGDAHELHGGKGEHGSRLFGGGRLERVHPFIHVAFHDRPPDCIV